MIVPIRPKEAVMTSYPQSPPGNVRSLGSDIRLRRRDLGLGQEDLAQLSGASVRFIRNLEHGKATVRLDKVTAVLAALGLELRARVRVTDQ